MSTGITPGRSTRLEVNIPEPVLIRPSISISRYGLNLVERHDSATKGETWRLPSGHLVPKPYQLRESPAGTNSAAGIIKREDVTCIDDLKGHDVLAIYNSAGASAARTQIATLLQVTEVAIGAGIGLPYYFIKEHPASAANWEQELTADVTALPKPGVDPVGVDLDRVLISNACYASNQGYALNFYFDGLNYSDYTCLMTFYFGGPASVKPATARGGEFAISLYGDGRAQLWERLAAGWQDVGQFQWTDGARVGFETPHSLLIVPHGDGGLDILASTGQARPIPTMLSTRLHSWQAAGGWNTTHFDASQFGADYTEKATMTGAGPVRIDIRRDLNPHFLLTRFTYPATAAFEDSAFRIPATLPADQPLTLAVDAYAAGGASITASLYNAETDAAIAPAANGSYLIPTGTKALRVKAAIAGTPDAPPPVLYGITATVAGRIVELTPTPEVMDPLIHRQGGRVQITGPDLYPQNETCSLEALDATGEALSVLRYRGRVTARLVTRMPDGTDVVLFQGEVPRPRAQRTPTLLTPNRRVHELQLVGWWARLADKMSFVLQTFQLADPAWDPRGAAAKLPWKLTDILRWAFGQGGVPADMLDIPDLPMRFYAGGPGSAQEMSVQPTASFIEFILEIVRLLGCYLVWDANCLPRGKWRVKVPPQTAAGPLWNFTLSHPGYGKLPGAAQSYPALTTFAQELRTWIVAPEANKIIVTCSGQLTPGGESDSAQMVWAVNPDSYNYAYPTVTADGSSPDYLRGEVPLVVYDPALGSSDPAQTRANLISVLRNLYDHVAHAQLWCSFVAPFWPVIDPDYGHLRPARVYDPITLAGFPAWVRGCNPEFEADNMQWAHYTALFDLGSIPL